MNNDFFGILNAACTIGGIAAITYGAWSIYAPLGWIVLGAASIWLGLPDK